MSGFQKGATYEQIKAYVLEHSGLKVSSLYISQIKRKCGLEVIYALSDFLIMILSWLVKQSLRAFLFQEVQL